MNILQQIRPRYSSDGTGPAAPGTPQLLGAVTNTSFSVTWTPSSDISGVLGYRVYLAVDPGTPARISAVQYDTVACRWDFGSLTPNTSYRVQVDAVDVFGNASASKSAIATFTTTPAIATSIFADESNAIGFVIQGNTFGGGVQDNPQARIDASLADWIALQWKNTSAHAAEDGYCAQLDALNPTQIRLTYFDFRFHYDSAESDTSDETTQCVWKALNSNGAPDDWKARNAAGQHMAHKWSPTNSKAVNWAATSLNAEGKNLAEALWDRFTELFQTNLYDGAMSDDTNIRPNGLCPRGSPAGTDANWDYDRDGVDNDYRTDDTFGAAWMSGITRIQSVGRTRKPTWFFSTNTDVAFFGRSDDANGNYGTLTATPFHELDDLPFGENLFWYAGGWGWENQSGSNIPIRGFFSISNLFMAFELYRLMSRSASINKSGRRFAFVQQQLGLGATETPSALAINCARAQWAAEKIALDTHYGHVRNSQAPFFLDEMCVNLGAPIGTPSAGTLDMTVKPFTFTMRNPDLPVGNSGYVPQGGPQFYFTEYANALVVWRGDYTGLTPELSQFGEGSAASYTLPSAGAGKKWQRPNAASYVNPLKASRAMRNQAPGINNGGDATTSSLLPLHGEVFLRVNGAVNQPPSWSGTPSPVGTLGTASSFPFAPLSSDPEGDPITYTSEGTALPTGFSIAGNVLAYNGSGSVSTTTGHVIRATATGGSAASAPFSISVIPSPSDPNSPVLFFTDLSDGPKTGGLNNNGVWVTLYGRGFGASRGTGTVFLGGGQVVDYVAWSDKKIVVQLGAAVATGNFTITTDSGASTTGRIIKPNTSVNDFTVRSGSIKFIAASGTNGSGSHASPYVQAINRIRDNFAASDIWYFRAGTYNTQLIVNGWTGDVLNTGGGRSGAANAQTAFVAYPGEAVTLQIAGENCISLRDNTESCSNYVTFANLTLRGTEQGFNGGAQTSAGAEVPNSGGNYAYLIGCDIQTSATWNTQTGMVTIGGNGCMALGNTLHDSGYPATGGSGSPAYHNQNHGFYVQVGADDVVIAFNTLRNLNMGATIQVHTDSFFEYLNCRILYNHFIVTTPGTHQMRGVTCGHMYGSSTGSIVGNVFDGIGSPDGFSPTIVYGGQWDVDNNTYVNTRSGAPAVTISNAVSTETGRPNGANYAIPQVRARNNIFSAVSGYIAFGGAGSPAGNASSAQLTAANNLYTAGGSGPPFDTTRIEAAHGMVNVAGEDYRLGSGSAARNSGTAASLNANALIDRFGVSRPRESAVDIGAHEYV